MYPKVAIWAQEDPVGVVGRKMKNASCRRIENARCRKHDDARDKGGEFGGEICMW